MTPSSSPLPPLSSSIDHKSRLDFETPCAKFVSKWRLLCTHLWCKRDNSVKCDCWWPSRVSVVLSLVPLSSVPHSSKRSYSDTICFGYTVFVEQSRTTRNKFHFRFSRQDHPVTARRLWLWTKRKMKEILNSITILFYTVTSRPTLSTFYVHPLVKHKYSTTTNTHTHTPALRFYFWLSHLTYSPWHWKWKTLRGKSLYLHVVLACPKTTFRCLVLFLAETAV